MKEMVGGCCVCSDERGWTENPLVYCDGQGCNVAVHQACYGIIQVPKGPWYCRKCESQERAARVRCELCPMKDGALKRTDSNSWCHVVCALFIPEAWFANVQTMEPIVLKDVPQERFNKVVICYICEEQGRETKAATGACMQCNKNGCKQYFHVTCAQSQGLLCEEAGNYGDNVKYCGYCAYHCKKLKRDTNIKTIPAFKPIPSDTTPDSSPEKISPHKTDTEKKTPISEKKVMTPNSGSATDSSMLSPSDFTGFTSADIKDSTIKVEKPDKSATKPKTVNADDMSFTSKRDSYDKTSPSVFSSHNSPDTDTGTGKRSRSRSQEKGENKKKLKKPKAGSVGNRCRNSNDGVTSTNSGRRSSSTSLPITPSSTSSSSSSTTTHSKGKSGLSSGLSSPSFTNTSSVFGGSPFFQSLSASGPISLSSFNQSDEGNDNNANHGPPKIFPSLQESFRNDDQSNTEFPSSMEQLLERQWEQGSQFLLEQGQHFDIASLLNCLYQLQNENQQLGEYIKNLTSRRDHLLAVNARLSLPFTPNSTTTTTNDDRSHIVNGDITQDQSSESTCTNPSPDQDIPSPSDSTSPKTSVEGRLSASSSQEPHLPLFPANLTSSSNNQTSTSSSSSSNYNGVQIFKNKDKT